MVAILAGLFPQQHKVGYNKVMKSDQPIRLDRSVLTITTLQQADADDRAYWRSKTPIERLEALELIRQVVYQYDPVATRLQRILTGPEPLGS